MYNIKQLRNAIGVTQRQLAERMGVERSAVAKWEAGASHPSSAKLPALAEALGCSVEDLFSKQKNGRG